MTRARGSPAPLILACFLISGMPALVAQVVWMRGFARVFGSSTQATATVLTGFMVGLALGNALGARWADRVARPVRLYGILELSVGAFALVSLPLIEAVSTAADGLLAGDGVPGTLRTAALFLLSFAILLPPTALMGATFPLLASLAGRGTGPSIALLYAGNTLGAAAGALLSGFVLVPHLGFRRALWAAACLNVAAALLALGVREAPGELRPTEDAAGGDGLGRRATAAVLAFLAVSGAATMAYEIVMSRVTAMVFGSSVHSFALVLAAFLGGIALGGAAHHLLGGSSAGTAGVRSLPLWIVSGSLAALLMSLWVAVLPRFSFWLHHRLQDRYLVLKAVELVALSAIMLAPAFVLGATFPAALSALLRDGRRAGFGVGVGTAVNTVGAAAGALAVGFWLLPLHGIEASLEGAACAVAAAGAALQLTLPPAGGRRAVVAALAVAAFALAGLGPRWSREEMAEGLFRSWEHYEDYEAVRRELSGRKLVYYRDGTSATVAVFEHGDGFKSLRVNGKADASTALIDVQTQYLTGHLPALLHGNPRSALVIGLGSGATAHALAQYPTVTRVDVAEIEASVRDAAHRHFGELHRGVLNDPRVRLHVEDGRRFVRRAVRRYDVIVSEPSNPWVVGVGDLYTVEHYRRVRERLEEGGVFVQWIQGYSLSSRWLRAVLRTVDEVFPRVSVWFANEGDYLVVASEHEVAYDVARVRSLWYEVPFLEDELRACEVHGPRGILSRFLLDDAAVEGFAAGAELLTEDMPRLEFFAPLDLYGDTVGENFDALARRAVPCPVRDAPVPPRDLGREWADLARTARSVARTELALDAYRKATRANPLPDTYLAWASYLSELGRDAEARRVIDEALERTPGDTQLALRLSALLAATGRGRG